MPQTTLAMAAVGATNNWTLGAGADKVVAVATHDSDTTYVASGTTTGITQQYTVADPSPALPADAIINSVTVYVVGRRTGTAVNLLVNASQNGTNWTSDSTLAMGTTYPAAGSEQTSPFTTNGSGAAWSVADITNLQIRFRNSTTRDIRVTQVYVIVDYTVPFQPGRRHRAYLRF
jgi:hypothetical protein